MAGNFNTAVQAVRTFRTSQPTAGATGSAWVWPDFTIDVTSTGYRITPGNTISRNGLEFLQRQRVPVWRIITCSHLCEVNRLGG